MEKTIVKFKSEPGMWFKENRGWKPNTLRKVEVEDERFILLKKFNKLLINNLDIKIINSNTGEAFVRQVKDVTFWDNYVIISWRS